MTNEVQRENFEKRMKLIQETVCKGCSVEEVDLFKAVCMRTGLDPFMRQIWPVKRWDKKAGRNVMTIQTGIDGYRLIADRTGKYAPGKEPTFRYDKEGNLISATSYVLKQTPDGTWHEVGACAHFNEYKVTDKSGEITGFWKDLPHVMLSKCAEALALRKAFPGDFAQIYSQEEMDQQNQNTSTIPPEKKIEEFQINRLIETLESCGEEYKALIDENLSRNFNIDSYSQLSEQLYFRILSAARKKLSEEKLIEQNQEEETQNV